MNDDDKVMENNENMKVDNNMHITGFVKNNEIMSSNRFVENNENMNGNHFVTNSKLLNDNKTPCQ